MRYLSVCSGIEAASVAWHHLGWTPVAFSEIEPFPAAVLAHRFPNVPNYGDMTKHQEWPLEPGSIDLLVGGTPCQSFSVAGLRKGLHDPRGGLMLTYLEIAQRLRPQWVVWENVPGVLSSGGGRDFGSFLGALGELGYGWAYRVLDAQWVRTQRHPRAVPQRRRRVFVVGCLVERGAGDRNPAAQVLFERESVCRDSAKGRAAGEGSAADAEAGVGAGCWQHVAETLIATDHKGPGHNRDHNFIPQPVGYRWHIAESGKTRKAAPSDAEAGVGAGCVTSHDVAPCLETTSNDYSRADGFTMVGQPVAGTLGNRGLRSHRELDGHGAYIPVQPVPYDLFQITAPVNRQNRKPGDPCHTLARDNAAHAAVAFTPGNLARGAGPSPNAEVAPTQRCSAGRGADDQRTCVAHAFYSTGGTHGVNQHPEVSPAVKVGSGLGIPSPPAVAFTRCDNGRDASVEVTPTMRCGSNYSAHPAVAHALRGEGFDASEDGTGRGTPLVPVAPTLTAHNDPSRSPQSSEVTQQVAAVHAASMTVRRLTAKECERLQAFPDDYTLIPWRKKPATECPDGPRYKALGNSMAVNCMAWIGERIAAVETNNGADAAPPLPNRADGRPRQRSSTNGGE